MNNSADTPMQLPYEWQVNSMEKYVRKAIRELTSYEVHKWDYHIKLDANESIEWLEGLNRYPDDTSEAVISAIAQWRSVKKEQLLVGNGSSELIELTMKTFLSPGESVVTFEPTFSMYKIFTKLYSGKYAAMKMDSEFNLDVDRFIEFIYEEHAKLVIISNPNNPTGKVIPLEDIKKIAEQSDAIIILDEAYIEFGGESAIKLIEDYDNLIVLRTFSKAMGLAGIRFGYMIANEEAIGYIRRVKSPYNVNTVTQNTALKAFDNLEQIEENVELVKTERAWLFDQLETMNMSPVSSKANFILFKCTEDLYKKLRDSGILIRVFGGELTGYCRITVGTPAENRTTIGMMKGESA
jgi:histidinol-phosphate aminotransferase